MPSPEPVTVGVIANPASGRDIRRLTARASVFPTAEKANMVQRVLSACGALGVARVLMMPDMTGIAAAVKRAVDAHPADPAMPWPRVDFIDMDISESAADTCAAVAALRAAAARVIVVLGGDGTHRVVAGCCGDTPLATLSSGTNNAFPDLREATTTGIAAALLATGRVPAAEALRRHKCLRVACGERRELALVDVCVTAHEHVGARALWQAASLRELFVAFAEPDAVGLSAVAGLVQPVGRDEARGLHLVFDPAAPPAAAPRVLAPIAPGLLAWLAVASQSPLAAGVDYRVAAAAGTVALDGEREFAFAPGDRPRVRLDLDGPLTVDVPRTLRAAAARRVLWAP